MTRIIAGVSGALILLTGAASSAPSVAAAGRFHLESTIAFTSTRDDPGAATSDSDIFLCRQRVVVVGVVGVARVRDQPPVGRPRGSLLRRGQARSSSSFRAVSTPWARS
jgi:hypothetical protein